MTSCSNARTCGLVNKSGEANKKEINKCGEKITANGRHYCCLISRYVALRKE